jgi:DNA-binding CsgD family transcriptional regulator
MEPRHKDPMQPPHEDPSSPRVVSLHVGDLKFAVLSVPLADSSTMAALTPVEREVATFAAAGLSNAAIGRCRGTAERTVANQMASILRKLRVNSRYELAARLALSTRGQDEP